MHIYPADFFDDGQYVVNPRLCFVLMPFSEEWSKPVFSQLKEIIESEGYSCTRGDDYYGRIILKDIWQEINEAAFIIADLTSANPNVYYELGIAHTLGKQVIPVIQRGEQLPFDQRAFRVLTYESTGAEYRELRERLPPWIRSLAFKTNPVVLLKSERVADFNAIRDDKTRPLHLLRDQFTHLRLSGVDLSQANLSESDMSGSDFSHANLSHATLIRVVAHATAFNSAVLHRANLSEGQFQDANFSEADLTRAVMLRVELDGADFAGADVAGMTIDAATYERFTPLLEQARNLQEIVIER